MLNGISGEESEENEYKISGKKVIFLDVGYGKEIETTESVEEIVREKVSSKKIKWFYFQDRLTVRYNKGHYIESIGENVCQNFMANCYYCLKNQQRILNELLTNSISAQCIKEFCYSVDGLLIPNMLAILRYRELEIFYKNIIEDLENDEYAFVKRQAEWLDIPEEKLAVAIQESRKNIFEKNCEILEQAIKEVLDKSLDKRRNIEWKLSISEVLIYFIKRDENFKKSEEDALKKTDRVIPKRVFYVA